MDKQKKIQWLEDRMKRLYEEKNDSSTRSRQETIDLMIRPLQALYKRVTGKTYQQPLL